MLYMGVYTMKKQYHVISAKNFGYESVLGDETYDYFVFPASEYSKFEAMDSFIKITKETLKANNHWYPYTAYEYRGTSYCKEHYGKQYYTIIYSGLLALRKILCKKKSNQTLPVNRADREILLLIALFPEWERGMRASA